jgi:purine-nucleoside phosphorylase
MSDDAFEKVSKSVTFLAEKFKLHSPNFEPKAAVVLGSGLADALPGLDSLPFLKFSEIPGFKETNVAGHVSEIRYGDYQGSQVVFLRGRNHAYEGFTPAEVVHNVRTMALLGIPNLVMTNAAGCLMEDWPVGDLMTITDHINLTGLNPLVGKETEKFGKPRFLDMTTCYSKHLQSVFEKSAQKFSTKLHNGVYLGVLGPCYESPAEVRMMKTLGAHAVGMSTVMEVIAAHHLGMQVGVVSCLTNLGAGLGQGSKLSHEEVLEVGKKSAALLANIVSCSLKSL